MNKKIISIGVALVICAMVAFSFFTKEKTTVIADSKQEVVEEEVKVENIFVEIKGAVNAPGVYNLKSDKRIFDAIELAGGLREDANINYINQTRILSDEMLIVVMTNVEIEQAIKNKELLERAESEVAVATSQPEVIGYDDCYTAGSTSNSSGLISINNASKEELMSLSGIGESKANDIISYRNSNGGFKSIEELREVNGIGEATFNKIKDSITL